MLPITCTDCRLHTLLCYPCHSGWRMRLLRHDDPMLEGVPATQRSHMPQIANETAPIPLTHLSLYGEFNTSTEIRKLSDARVMT